ncbi:hypothetical protein ACWCQZ_51000 [Streptomyces sp. NPDC002285]
MLAIQRIEHLPGGSVVEGGGGLWRVRARFGRRGSVRGPLVRDGPPR